MNYRKLFTKIYTAVILLSFIMADPNNDIELNKTGMDGIKSFTCRFIPEHGEEEFKFMPIRLNRFYSRCDMPVPDFNGIFRDATTRTHIKEDAYDTINNWFSNEILRRSINDPISPEGQTLLDNIKKIPLYYMYKTEDYGIINDSKDIAECLDFYWNENNLCVQVKNWGYFTPVKTNRHGVIFKDTSCVYPRERSIVGNDWTKMTIDSFEGYPVPIPVPGGGATTSAASTLFATEVGAIATGMREMSASTQNEKRERERAKDTIDTDHVDFPADVATIVKKVSNREWLCTSDINAFNNPLTVDADNNVVDKNFIEWPETHKTFLINKDGFDFPMLHFTMSQKRDKFVKAFSKFDNWSFVGYHAWYIGFCQVCRSHCVWVPTFHMYDSACNDVRGFICGDGSDAHIPASYKELLKH